MKAKYKDEGKYPVNYVLHFYIKKKKGEQERTEKCREKFTS